MELLKAIEIADSLCPNPYTQEEKLRWCEEVSAVIRREIKKIYDVVETKVSADGDVVIPDEIPFEDIEAAYVNGRYMDKLDFRSFAATGYKGSSAVLKLVYLTRPEPVRNICISGKFDISENYIKMDLPPFIPEDCLEWVILEGTDAEPDWSNAQRCYVLERTYDGLLVDEGAFTPQTAADMVIRRVIDDVTEIDEPAYDGMYVEYLLAKMALYQHDYTGYNAHMAQYNIIYDSLRRDYKSRAPLNGLSVFRNYWQV